MEKKTSSITILLRRHQKGDGAAMGELAELVFQRLRILARSHLKKNSQKSIQSTELVSELFMRLMQAKEIGAESRAQFFCLASTAMRRILIDHARKRKAGKRGVNPVHVALDENSPAPEHGVDILILDEALKELGKLDPRLVKIVELKCFSGFSVEEIADILDTSTGTVKREWAKAKLWLARALQVAA